MQSSWLFIVIPKNDSVLHTRENQEKFPVKSYLVSQ